MNTIDAKPQTSLGDRATLVRRHYPEVNALIRTNPKCQETFVNVIYGKQSLTTHACRSRWQRGRPAAGCERRIEPPNDRSPAA
jgi:hypothetical protein